MASPDSPSGWNLFFSGLGLSVVGFDHFLLAWIRDKRAKKKQRLLETKFHLFNRHGDS